MRDLLSAASVRILLADYVSVDAAGKLNIIGGGVAIVGSPGKERGATGDITAPFGIVLSVSVGEAHFGDAVDMELSLEDSKQDIVSIPNAATGVMEPLRVAERVVFDEPTPGVAAGVDIPRGALMSRVQWILMFSGGLSLPPGDVYLWRLSLDGASRTDWTEQFYVAGVPGPIGKAE